MPKIEMPEKLVCEKCGDVDFVHVDGYGFGDRLLEGVRFRVAVKGGKFVVLGVCKEDKKYFETLNTKMWLESCHAHCEDGFEQGELICTCPKCGDDIYLPG